MFSQLDDSYRSTMKLRDDSRVTLMGKETLEFKLKIISCTSLLVSFIFHSWKAIFYALDSSMKKVIQSS